MDNSWPTPGEYAKKRILTEEQRKQWKKKHDARWARGELWIDICDTEWTCPNCKTINGNVRWDIVKCEECSTDYYVQDPR